VTVSLGVVTVTYRSRETIGPFLDSMATAVRAAGLSGDVRVVVAENASDQATETRAVVEQHGADFVALTSNEGYGAGVREAFRRLPAGLDYVVVSNPDVVVREDAIATLLSRAEARPDAGALGPRIVDLSGSVYPSARALPSLRTGVGHALLGVLWPSNPWSTAYKKEHAELRERDAGWLSGAFLLVRRSAWDMVGGFDDKFFMYFEDVDLGQRLGRAGWANVYVPDAEVVHSGAHSTSTTSRTMERVHHESAYRYLAGRYRGPALAPLRLVLRVGLAARSRWLSRR
jgi:N-acetylglucosaminyl-diphospho-decaprenol L-rhamnosyltransferase